MVDRIGWLPYLWKDDPVRGLFSSPNDVQGILRQLVADYARRTEAEQRLWLVLHRQVDRLPLAERLPLIHCDLQGWPEEEAAEYLDWNRQTVREGLLRGRRLLSQGLHHQGLSLPASSAGPLLRQESECGAVPPRLLADTIRLAARPWEDVPAPVAELIVGVP